MSWPALLAGVLNPATVNATEKQINDSVKADPTGSADQLFAVLALPGPDAADVRMLAAVVLRSLLPQLLKSQASRQRHAAHMPQWQNALVTAIMGECVLCCRAEPLVHRWTVLCFGAARRQVWGAPHGLSAHFSTL